MPMKLHSADGKRDQGNRTDEGFVRPGKRHIRTGGTRHSTNLPESVAANQAEEVAYPATASRDTAAA